MHIALPDAGAANDDIVRLCRETWVDAATRAGIDLTGFNPAAPFQNASPGPCPRAWKLGRNLSRFSSEVATQYGQPSLRLRRVRRLAQNLRTAGVCLRR